MLDRSIPWHSFIMSLDPDNFVHREVICDSFSVRPYSGEKDALAWAKIETAVGEFNSIEEALSCHKHYLEYPDELHVRQWFVVDENDDAVATCTVWWSGESRIPCIHALSCLPEYQGKGLGRMAASNAIEAMLQNDRQTIWLETQTWSWKAVCLYLSLGFVPRRKATFNDTPNEFEISFQLMSRKIGENVSERIRNCTID